MNIILQNKLLKQEIEKENKKKYDEFMKEKKIMDQYFLLNKVYRLKNKYSSIIPLHLYTCWHTKNLPPLMQSNYNYLVESNPKITFHLYDENECRQFIQEHFDYDILDAYNKLIPCSYKSDLWRFCVLYINGGIYMDIKYRCVNNFKFIDLTEEEHFVRDRPEKCIYTALIVTLPKNEIMRKCIYQIVKNVNNKYYGTNPLDPTGPGLLGKYFTSSERINLNMYYDGSFIENKLNEYYIVKDGTIILKNYSGYRDEQKIYQKNKYYSDLWHEKNIYV
jgi:mannosyltransferase OCH1-like enzyme